MKSSLFRKITIATIASLLFIPISMIGEAFAYPHPGGLYSQALIDSIKSNVKANLSPWKPAYDSLVAKAKWLQTEVPSAVQTFYVPAYYSGPAAHIAASALLQDDVKAAYVSAAAYALTGTNSFADKAIEIMNNWARVNTGVGGDDSSLVMSYAGVAFIQSAELLQNYSGWNASDKAQFKSWVSDVFLDKVANANKMRTNNWGMWGVLGSISAYHYLDDPAHVRSEIDLIKAKIDAQIASNGAITEEVKRGASGLQYTYFYLAPLTAAAQVALDSEGVDLFNWVSPQGKTIKSALDYLLYYMQHPSSWPYAANPELPSASDPWPSNLFEAMANYYPDPAYEAFAASKRPLMQTGHHYAWTFPTVMKSTRTLVSETFDNMPTGTPPVGWTVTNSTDSSASIVNVSQDKLLSLKITDTNANGASLVQKNFTAQSGTVTAQWSVMEQALFPYAKFGLKSGTNFAIELYTAGPNLAYRLNNGNYINVQSFKPNTWYTIKVTANILTNSYDIYVDGILKASNVVFTNPASTINGIAFYGGWGPTGTVFIDDVGVIK